MLRTEIQVFENKTLNESSQLTDHDFREQGYLWLCGVCENQPTFETIYDLFHHKKTHSLHSTTEIKSEFQAGVLDCNDCNNISLNNKQPSDISKKVHDEGPFLDSPLSFSSEDIPLATLMLNDSSDNIKKSKLSKKKKPSQKDDNVQKKNSNVTNVPFSSATPKEEKISIDVIETKPLSDLLNLKEEREYEEIKERTPSGAGNKDTEEDLKKGSVRPKIKHFCKICNTEFSSRFALSSHKKTHLFQDSGCYKCETCGKMCPKYDNFTRHLTIHSTNREKTHQCTQCFASFYYYADLKRHLVLHLAVKPFRCEHCGEGFIRQDNLLIHMYKHTGVQYKKFACKDCNKILNSPSSLVMHAKTHSAKTVFCTEPGCKFSCYLQSQLRQHVRKHSGEKPFQCAKCGRCFTRCNDMKNHILNVHEGIKPYKCSSCPKEFALIGNYKNHKITHTNERPFLCAQCGKSFNQSSTLKKHSSIMHNPWRTSKKEKKFKKASLNSKGDKETENKKTKELLEKENKGGKKVKKVECESSLLSRNGKQKQGEGITLSSGSDVGSSVIQEISREAQIQVPQITVSLPIQLDHSQAFFLPTVILEQSIIRSDN